jgi:PGF-pre-PGF domain-containing protein
MRNALLFASGNGLISIDGNKGEGIPAPPPEYELTPGFTYANFVNVLSSKVNSYQIEGAAITGMEFGCSRSFQNVQLLVDETNENPLSPVQVPLDGVQVYKYEKVVVGVPKASIEGASFTFRVDLGWCSAMGVDEAAVAMYRFDGLSWVELPTTMLYEDSGFAYYSSQSAGLGYFAIAG